MPRPRRAFGVGAITALVAVTLTAGCAGAFSSASSPTSSVEPCDAASLNVVGHLWDAAVVVEGYFTVETREESSCSLPRELRLKLFIDNHPLSAVQTGLTGSKENELITGYAWHGHISKGDGALVPVVWGNWCGPDSANGHVIPLAAQLHFDSGTVHLILRAPHLGPVTAPYCLDSKKASEVGVGSIMSQRQ
jgi:hypothetical protein